MTAKNDFNDRTIRCFICEKWVENIDYPILPCELEKSQMSLLPRINQLVGKALVSLISDNDFLCEKCGTLMDHMNDLETKLDSLKSTLAALLHRKFNHIFNTTEELGGTCSDFEADDSGNNGNNLCETSQDKFCALKFSKEAPFKENCITMSEEESHLSSTKPKKYSCKFCSFSSDFVERLKLHVSSQHKEFMCSICHEVFTSSVKVQSHIKEIHLTKWTCQFCDKTFLNKVHYVNHTNLHLKGISEDSVSQIQKEKRNLLINIKEECSENYESKIKAKNYQCNFCEFTTDSKILFDDHIRSHVILKLFKCEDCGLLFESKASLNDHEKTHTKTVYRCGVCENTYQSRECVIRHFNEEHKHHHSTEKSDPRPFRRRKQTYNNLLTDLSFNSETAKSSVNSQRPQKSIDLRRCDEPSSSMDGVDLDSRENQEVTLTEDFSCGTQPDVVEKENSRFGDFIRRITNEILPQKVLVTLVKSFLRTRMSQTQECQNTTSDSFESIKNGVAPKEEHFTNLSGHQEEGDITIRSETCLLPVFGNVVNAENDNLEVSTIVSTGNGYSDSRSLHSHRESNIGSLLNESSNVNFKSIKLKAIDLKEGLVSGIKLMEECVDSENESEPIWISLNSLGSMENENYVIQENPNAEPPKPSKVFVCGKCGFKSVTALGIKEHFASHVTSKLPEFQMEGDALISALNLTHPRSDVPDKQVRDNKLACSYCSWESSDKLLLRNHINECHLNVRTTYTCRYCKKSFMTKLRLNHHEESHGRNKIYHCKMCNKGFTRETLLNKHRRIVHSTNKCCYCTKTFLNADDLSKHKSKHECEDGFQCLECPRIFKTKTGLKFHSAQHTGEYKFRCQYCDQGFMSRVVYQEHMGKHTKEERYVCDVCGRKFCFQSTYWIHRKWHDTPFPYKCDICDRPFRHSSLLKVHKRQHTGERPYHCPHCSRSFSVSGTLKRHLMLHTGEYAFNCGECEKGFTTRNKFALHLSRVHGNDSMLQQGPPKTEFKMVIRDSPKLPIMTDRVTEEGMNQKEMVIETYEELDSMMVQDGGIVGDGAELLKETGLMLPCAILDDVDGGLETRVVEILVNDETSQAVATVTVEGNSSLVSW